MPKTLTFTSIVVLTAVLCLIHTDHATPKQAYGGQQFQPGDTSRLLGSPDPMPSLEIEKAFPGLRFERPLQLTSAGDGSNRIFVVTQKGLIYVFPNRKNVTKDQCRVFLDWSRRVRTDENEEGMMGLAFHPRFRENGLFYVYYTTRPLQSVVARFRVKSDDPDRADPDSFDVLLNFPQPYWNHNGGSMEFGPDGHLYIGLGDGGSAGDPHQNAQNLKTLLGKILRIDVDHADAGLKYAIPRDNPFADRRDGARREIWTLGMRNVWRLSFDRLTGTLWAGDVGQDKYEEVDVIQKGGNYGWNLREGFHPFRPQLAKGNDRLIDPIIEYDHSVGKCIIGGVVYRGKKLPELYGAYLYADFVSGQVWALRYNGAKATSNATIVRPKSDITSFGEDERGEVYFTDFDGYIYNFRKAASPTGRQADVAPFPRLLSETALFTDTKSMTPAPGLIPYGVNVPLWSDGAEKDRYLALPRARSIKFSRTDSWQFPTGTVFVKTFSLDLTRGDPASRRRLETRLLVLGNQGWAGYTYLWNDEQTDAQLLDAALRRTYDIKSPQGMEKQTWYYPSRADCMACHTPASGFALGWNTRQINRNESYGSLSENQLHRLDALGVFQEPFPDMPAKLEKYPDWTTAVRQRPTATLARAYLDVNCSICHRPGGTSNTGLDMRFHTPLSDTHLLNTAPANGEYGPEGSRIIAPGDPDRSILVYRMRSRGEGQMPNLATYRTDQEAMRVIEAWIRTLKNK
jgi:uncharacterized repeat protein (TIGR03806 family)